jgi:hypothetical protein
MKRSKRMKRKEATMIKNDVEILTFSELQKALGLTLDQLNDLVSDGLSFIPVREGKLFLTSSLKIYFGRIEKKKSPKYPPERE